ncbi:MAG: 6,7-dimethyl-8-ribityllumazine synthase [Acidimicrobiia bacterium]|nr:6,7-dimethyl-8-ribityllumazine synthase [Acidimicrobiia bacterium]
MRVDGSSHSDVSASGLRVAVVTSLFHASVTKGLTAGAVAWLEEADADEILVIDAPGAFELPLIAKKLAEIGYDAVVCLGAVIEGDTDHYEHVAGRTSEGIMRVQLDTGVPVGFGVLTVRSLPHAVERSQPGEHNKGREAATAAVMAANVLRTLDHS